MLEDAWTVLRKEEAFRYVPVPVGNTDGPRDSRVDPPSVPRKKVEGQRTDSSVAS